MIFAIKEGLQYLNRITKKKKALWFPEVSRTACLGWPRAGHLGSCLRLAPAAKEMSPDVRSPHHSLKKMHGKVYGADLWASQA